MGTMNFCPVEGIAVAAAFGGCGFEANVHKGIDFQKEFRYDNWNVGERSLENPSWEARSIYRAHRAGLLPADHPFSVGLLAIRNRSALLGWVENGGGIRLERHGEGLWAVVRTTDGSARRQPTVFRTTDILIGAALATVGCDPVAAHPPSCGNHIQRISFNKFSRQDQAGMRIDAVEIASAFRDGRLAESPSTVPFLRAMKAGNCYQRLAEHVNRAVPILFVTGSHPTRHAYVRADCSGTMHDKLRQFFAL